MCRAVTSWMDTLDFRLNGSVPIKGGFNASFIFRNTVGANLNANATVTAANIVFKNGRASNTITGGGQVVALRTANSDFGDRFSQLDLAISRSTDIGFGRLRLAFDLYNALNSNSIQNVTTTLSFNQAASRWQRPSTFLDPRLARVTASLAF